MRTHSIGGADLEAFADLADGRGNPPTGDHLFDILKNRLLSVGQFRLSHSIISPRISVLSLSRVQLVPICISVNLN